MPSPCIRLFRKIKCFYNLSPISGKGGKCEVSEAWERGQAREIELNSLQQLNTKLGNQVRYLYGADIHNQ